MAIFLFLAFKGALAFVLLSITRVDSINAQNQDELGDWGELFDLEIIPIHAMLLPDANVLFYGSDTNGKQGGDMFYEIWDPLSRDHQRQRNLQLLRQSTSVDIFCSTSSIDISTGNFLIIGGDDGDNNGIKEVLEFDTKTFEIREHPKGRLKYPRWYATAVNLPNGDILVVGGKGRESKWESAACELWTPENGFHALPATELPALNERRAGSWWYPIVAVNSSGDIVVIIADGKDTDIYRLEVDGDGSIETVGKKPFSMDQLGPSLMFDMDQVMFIAKDGGLWVADISDSRDIVFSERNNVGSGRTNAAMNTLPDGRVIITGGSDRDDDLGNEIDWAVKYVQIWDPRANTLYKGPKEELPRLYHSSGLILPDGSVFSGGGGAPGPLKNLNGNTYKPGYLFDQSTGEKSTRPVILSWPKNLQPGETFVLSVDDANKVDQVTMTKPGSMTHSRNCDHRWLNLNFGIINGKTIEVHTPHRNVMIPGLWMVNVIDDDGFPSESRLLGVNMAAATNIYVPEDMDLTPSTEPPAPTFSLTNMPTGSPRPSTPSSFSLGGITWHISPQETDSPISSSSNESSPPPQQSPILTPSLVPVTEPDPQLTRQPTQSPPTELYPAFSLGGITWHVHVDPPSKSDPSS